MKPMCLAVGMAAIVAAPAFGAERVVIDARAPVPGRQDQARALLELKKEFRSEFAQRVGGSPFEYTRWSVWARNHMPLRKEGDVIFIIGHLTGEPGMWNKGGGDKSHRYICEWEK